MIRRQRILSIIVLNNIGGLHKLLNCNEKNKILKRPGLYDPSFVSVSVPRYVFLIIGNKPATIGTGKKNFGYIFCLNESINTRNAVYLLTHCDNKFSINGRGHKIDPILKRPQQLVEK